MNKINNFLIIIGAMKAGTTSLFKYLSKHPSICPCREKEPNFFGDTELYSQGLELYCDLWDWDEKKHKIALEATMLYTWFPLIADVPERMKASECNFKFIYILRHPIERIESHIQYDLSSKGAALWYDSKLEELPQWIIDISRYYQQLSIYNNIFPKEDILIVDFDDLKYNAHLVLEKICNFIGIEPYNFEDMNKVYNPTIGAKKPNSLWLSLKKQKLLHQMVRKLPLNLRINVKNLLSTEIKEPLRLTESQRNYVYEQVKEDMDKLSQEYGFNTQKWGF